MTFNLIKKMISRSIFTTRILNGGQYGLGIKCMDFVIRSAFESQVCHLTSCVIVLKECNFSELYSLPV